MNADRYDQMSLPTLRLELTNRGLPFDGARTENELRTILRANDTGHNLVPRTPSPVLRPPGAPSPPLTGRVRPVTTTTAIPFDVNATQRVPVLPITPGTPQRVPVLPITTATPRRIPVLPGAPATGAITPTIPVTGRPAVTGAITPTVPVVPVTAKPAVPVVPVTAKPAVPVVPVTATPTVPVAGRPTVPVVPVTTNRPTVPVVPVAGKPTVPVVPVAGRPTVSVAGRPTVPVVPVTTNRPVVPVAPTPIVLTPELMQESIRRKTGTATFDFYNAVWKDTLGHPNAAERTNGINFRRVFQTYQRINLPTIGSIYVFEYLMTGVELNFIAELTSALGFRRLNANADVYFNLLWYLNVADDPFALHLTTDEIEYISTLEEPALLDLLGAGYNGPRDKASLLFALVSGKSAFRPDLHDLPRYESVKFYPPASLWAIAQDMYSLITSIDLDGRTQRIVSPLPPYIYVATQPENDIERIIASVNATNVDQYLETFRVVLSPNTPTTAAAKVKYFTQEIGKYDAVFKRSPTLIPPPVLTGKTKHQVETDLAPYTLKEIVDAYEPIGTWTDRETLTRLVGEESRGGSTWSWRNLHCNNDNTMNHVEFPPTLHGEMNKNDPTNPTLSYGVPKNYRCYQVEELVVAFTNADNFFNVPDYDAQNPIIDPTTGANLVQYFPPQSMIQLRTLLERAPARYQVRGLLDKIRANLDANRLVVQTTNQLRAQFEAKSENEQYLIKVYLAWMFFYAMWMRFWKGPGNPWPTNWVEYGGFDGRCEESERDWHVSLQGKIRDFILTTMNPATYPGLVTWIDNLPLINYDFKSESATMSTDTNNIKRIIDITLAGTFCLAHGSDLVIRTAYYLITKLLNLKNDFAFNAFINEFAPVVFNMEQQTIAWLLETPTENHIDEAILRNRAAELQRPLGRFPQFVPRMLERSGHTDYELGRRLNFE